MRLHAKPCFRWVGAKRWIVPIIADEIDAYLTDSGGRYIEPFLGGASLALDLGLPKMSLSDVCAPLISAYRAITSDHERVSRTVETMVANVGGQINKKTYYEVRNLRVSGDFEAAARMLILNSTCFNGVYRENASGAFNVPYGMRTEAHIPGVDVLQAISVAFATSVIRVADFRETIGVAGAGDVVFADPPYYSSFVGYSAEKFDSREQEALAEVLRLASERGARVYATNDDCEAVRRMYAWGEVSVTSEPRKVSRDGAGRKAKSCVLVRG